MTRWSSLACGGISECVRRSPRQFRLAVANRGCCWLLHGNPSTSPQSNSICCSSWHTGLAWLRATILPRNARTPFQRETVRWRLQTNGATVQHLSPTDRAILASAYQLRGEQVEDDADSIREWVGSDRALLEHLRERHGWSVASEYGPYYLADIRHALLPVGRNGAQHDH